jgi:tRNA (adenine57-N1/adenine58-N1)-methyltransferase catalytic subunit
VETIKTNVEQNDVVVLVDETLRKIFVDTAGKTDKIKGIGVIDPKILIGKTYGSRFEYGNKQFWILVPSLQDKLQGLHRQAQIILPRDAAHILMNCSVGPGQTVLEAGIGSGSLTIALASAVAPTGKVISYDIREEFVEHAMKNLKQASLAQYVTTKIKDVTTGIDETDLDAVILDIPNPWTVVKHAWDALKVGGYFCAYSPLISQVEQTVNTIALHPFIECKTYENIQREMVISKHGTRPSFDMLGHTGYLTFARKVTTL